MSLVCGVLINRTRVRPHRILVLHDMKTLMTCFCQCVLPQSLLLYHFEVCLKNFAGSEQERICSSFQTTIFIFDTESIPCGSTPWFCYLSWRINLKLISYIKQCYLVASIGDKQFHRNLGLSFNISRTFSRLRIRSYREI